jgi:hypothetical protein
MCELASRRRAKQQQSLLVEAGQKLNIYIQD